MRTRRFGRTCPIHEQMVLARRKLDADHVLYAVVDGRRTQQPRRPLHLERKPTLMHGEQLRLAVLRLPDGRSDAREAHLEGLGHGQTILALGLAGGEARQDRAKSRFRANTRREHKGLGRLFPCR